MAGKHKAARQLTFPPAPTAPGERSLFTFPEDDRRDQYGRDTERKGDAHQIFELHPVEHSAPRTVSCPEPSFVDRICRGELAQLSSVRPAGQALTSNVVLAIGGRGVPRRSVQNCKVRPPERDTRQFRNRRFQLVSILLTSVGRQ